MALDPAKSHCLVGLKEASIVVSERQFAESRPGKRVERVPCEFRTDIPHALNLRAQKSLEFLEFER